MICIIYNLNASPLHSLFITRDMNNTTSTTPPGKIMNETLACLHFVDEDKRGVEWCMPNTRFVYSTVRGKMSAQNIAHYTPAYLISHFCLNDHSSSGMNMQTRDYLHNIMWCIYPTSAYLKIYMPLLSRGDKKNASIVIVINKIHTRSLLSCLRIELCTWEHKDKYHRHEFGALHLNKL